MPYDTDYTPAYNLFIEQNKKMKDKLSPEEWNDIINILAAQADSTAVQVKKVHDYLSGGISSIDFSEDPPEDANVQIWGKIV